MLYKFRFKPWTQVSFTAHVRWNNKQREDGNYARVTFGSTDFYYIIYNGSRTTIIDLRFYIDITSIDISSHMEFGMLYKIRFAKLFERPDFYLLPFQEHDWQHSFYGVIRTNLKSRRISFYKNIEHLPIGTPVWFDCKTGIGNDGMWYPV